MKVIHTSIVKVGFESRIITWRTQLLDTIIVVIFSIFLELFFGIRRYKWAKNGFVSTMDIEL